MDSGHHIVLVTPDDADWLVFYSEWMEPEENEFLKIKKRNDFDRQKETKLVCVCAPLFFFILSWTQVLLRTRPTTSDPIDPCPTGFKWFCVWSFSNSVQSINLQSKRFRKQNLELLFIFFSKQICVLMRVERVRKLVCRSNRWIWPPIKDFLKRKEKIHIFIIYYPCCVIII